MGNLKLHRNLKAVLIFSFIFILSISLGYAQLQSDSILVDGHYRSFHYQKPAPPSTRETLVFVMHGSGGEGRQMLRHTTQLEAMASKENMLIVYPDGYKRFWNECRSMSTAEANKIDINEQSFFESMIVFFHKRFAIKEDQVFAAGFSGGGQMAYKLAITMPDRFRAVAAIVANMPDSAYCDCTEKRIPVSVLIINGTEDPVNPYNGGEMFVSNASFGVVRSTEASFRYWSHLAGYVDQPVQVQLPDTDTADHRIIQSFEYSAAGKPEVNLLKVIGGRHDYPRDIDVYEYVGQFFRRQLLRNK